MQRNFNFTLFSGKENISVPKTEYICDTKFDFNKIIEDDPILLFCGPILATFLLGMFFPFTNKLVSFIFYSDLLPLIYVFRVSL